MTTLFFIFGLFFLWGEALMFQKADTIPAIKKKIKSWAKDKEDGKGFSDSEQIRFALYVIFHLLYMIWAIFGILMASQWKIFILLVAWGFIIGKIQKKSSDESKPFIIKVDSIISSLIVGYIILNHFRHLDLFLV